VVSRLAREQFASAGEDGGFDHGEVGDDFAGGPAALGGRALPAGGGELLAGFEEIEVGAVEEFDDGGYVSHGVAIYCTAGRVGEEGMRGLPLGVGDDHEFLGRANGAQTLLASGLADPEASGLCYSEPKPPADSKAWASRRTRLSSK